MKVAVAQMSSRASLETNLATMERMVGEAAAAGAALLAFPELAYLYGPRKCWEGTLGEFERLKGEMGRWAARYRIAVSTGSLREPVPGDPTRYFNTQLLLGPDGGVLSAYRKLFLFKAALPDRSYDETRDSVPGSEVATAAWGDWTLGLAICFDLRFPELFRALRKRGARCFLLPAAFTVPTGEAHWDSLTRARAIENQAYLLAPAQWGTLENGAQCYGHSRIVDPWGKVVAERTDGDGLLLWDLSTDALTQAEQRVPAWLCRREDRFPIA